MEKIKLFFINVGKAICSWFKNWSKAKTFLCIALALVLLGGFVGSMIQTDFFRVSVVTKTIEVDISQTTDASSSAIQKAEDAGVLTKSVADIYKPNYASAENPVPMVLVAPGIQRTKETQASFCIELVRRGFGVICLDPYGQGESTPSYESQSATREGYGLFHWVDYMYTAEGMEYFDWVDYSRIGATGHSAGGNGAQKLAEREGKIAADKKTTSRIQAVYITGFIRGWTWKNATCNIGVSYSSQDEGAYQNKTAQKKNEIKDKLNKNPNYTLTADEEFWLSVGNGDMRYAQESIDIVNYQLARAGQGSVSEVEVGVGYGNPYEGTYAIINNESCLHAFQPYDTETLANMVGFFGYVFDNYDVNNLQNGLKDTDHIWLVKEIGGGMALVGGFMFILALFVLLLETKLFKSMKKEIPARTGNQKVKGRILFWVFFAVSAVIAALLYMVAVTASVEWFPDAANSIQTWVFPQRFTNAIMIWAVANGLIGIAIFFLTWGIEYFIDYVKARKKAKKQVNVIASASATVSETSTTATATVSISQPDMLEVKQVHASYKSKLDPIKMSGSDFWKTPLLAAILILSFFALDGIIYGIFHVDMRFFFISARFTLNPQAILAMAMYIPFFFIFYMSNSLRVNCGMRPSNWPEWLSQVIAVLGNTLGLVALVVIQYSSFVSTGVVGFTGEVGPQWLFVNMLFSIIPMMVALPLFNRFFFNKSGRAWVGALVICTIFIIMTGSGTTIYYAL